MTDPADALNELADDLEADAHHVNTDTDAKAGMVEGLGRAVGKARARAERLDDE